MPKKKSKDPTPARDEESLQEESVQEEPAAPETPEPQPDEAPAPEPETVRCKLSFAQGRQRCGQRVLEVNGSVYHLSVERWTEVKRRDVKALKEKEPALLTTP